MWANKYSYEKYKKYFTSVIKEFLLMQMAIMHKKHKNFFNSRKSRSIIFLYPHHQGWMDILLQPKWMDRITMMFLIMSCWLRWRDGNFSRYKKRKFAWKMLTSEKRCEDESRRYVSQFKFTFPPYKSDLYSDNGNISFSLILEFYMHKKRLL